MSRDRILEIVQDTAGGFVDLDAPLMDSGIDSLGALEVRNQLDVPYSSKDNPLMVRLRDHVHEISLLLTGTGLPEPGDGGTTLHDLIQNVQLLNRSVCTTNDPTCTVQ